jgi:DNA-binding transcriptional LysR family regulator
MMVHMLTAHIDRVDLNLIGPLVALLEERHVSRAADRVGLSQPAMSRALQRLRRVLDDPLLIREPDGYRLSERARQLHDQLATVIPQLEALLAPDRFDPRKSDRPIELAGTDYAATAFGPAICRRLLVEAPLAPVRFHGWRYDRVAEQIRRGTVDLGLFGSHTGDELSAQELLVEPFVCVVDACHPMAGAIALTIDDYLNCRHLVIDVVDGQQPDIDGKLAALGRVRNAAVTVPYHAVVPRLLGGTDLVATQPGRLVATWPDTLNFRILAAPPEIELMTYRMIWHPAFDNDRRHQWLRGVVRAAAADWSKAGIDH